MLRQINVTSLSLAEARQGKKKPVPSPKAHFPPKLYLSHQIFHRQRIHVVVDYRDGGK